MLLIIFAMQGMWLKYVHVNAVIVLTAPGQSGISAKERDPAAFLLTVGGACNSSMHGHLM